MFWVWANSMQKRAVNRQPGYRAGTRRADTQMFKVQILIHSIYFPDFRIFIKFSHFRFSWKNVNIFLKTKMKCIFGFDQCIWKLLFLSITLVLIAYLNSFNTFPDFLIFIKILTFSDFHEKMSTYFWKRKWNAFSDLINAFESSCSCL